MIGTQAVARAFTRALKQEIEASQRAAQQRNSNNNASAEFASNAKLGMTLQEALQILNIDPSKMADKDLIEARYKHLFEVNDKSKGGSFYLQSKRRNLVFPNGTAVHSPILVQKHLFSLNRRQNYSTKQKLDVEELNKIISEENIKKCIERLNRLTFGKIRPDVKKACIFVPFCYDRDSTPSILYTRRSFNLTKHKGEICFPGGLEEQQDSGVIDSAIRETIEEIGVSRDDIKIYGSINPLPFNEVALHPVLGYLNIDHKRPFNPNRDEVDSIHIVKLEELLDGKKWRKTEWTGGWTTPVFLAKNHPRIWGMTAAITYIVMANLAPRHFEFDFTYLQRRIDLQRRQ